MPKRRISIFLPALIAVVALPEAVALGMYYYTNDPTLLPLGITKASLSDAPISRNTRAITKRTTRANLVLKRADVDHIQYQVLRTIH